MIAVVCSILALLCFLLALFGAHLGFDVAVLGQAFLAATLLAMNLPAWRTRP